MIDIVFAGNGPQPGVEQRSTRSNGGVLYDEAVRRGMKGRREGDAISFESCGRGRGRGGHCDRRPWWSSLSLSARERRASVKEQPGIRFRGDFLIRVLRV
jgi:hypothetical protein